MANSSFADHVASWFKGRSSTTLALSALSFVVIVTAITVRGIRSGAQETPPGATPPPPPPPVESPPPPSTPPPTGTSYSYPSGGSYSYPSGGSYSYPSGGSYSYSGGGTTYSSPSTGGYSYSCSNGMCTDTYGNSWASAGSTYSSTGYYGTTGSAYASYYGGSYGTYGSYSNSSGYYGGSTGTYSSYYGNTGYYGGSTGTNSSYQGTMASMYSMPPCAAGQMPTAAQPCAMQFGGTPGGTTGTYASYAPSAPCGPNVYPTPQNPCIPGGTYGGSGNERCFVSATWTRADNSTFGGSLSCVRDGSGWQDCREFTESGTPVPNSRVSAFQNVTSCYHTGGTYGATSGTYGGSTGGYYGGTSGTYGSTGGYYGGTSGNYQSPVCDPSGVCRDPVTGNTWNMYSSPQPIPGGNYNNCPPCPPGGPCPAMPCYGPGGGGGMYGGQPGGMYGYPGGGMYGAPGYNSPYNTFGFNQEEQQRMMQEQQQRMAEEVKFRAASECERLMDPLRYGGGMQMTSQVKDQVTALVSECKEQVASLVSGNDASAAPRFWSEIMPGFHRRLGEIMQSIAACHGVDQMIAGMKDGAQSASSVIAKQTDPEVASTMQSLQSETLAGVAQAEQLIASNKCEDARGLMERLGYYVESTLRKLGPRAIGLEDEFVDHGAMARKFGERLGGYGVGDFSEEDFLRYGFGSDDFAFAGDVLTFADEGTAELLSNELGANVVKSLSGIKGADASIVALLLQKVHELQKTVEELTAKLNAMQAALAEKLSTIVWASPEEQAKAEDFLENELPDLTVTPEQVEEIYRSFKLENGQVAVEQGLVPNPDLGFEDWYTEHAIRANEFGLMKGDASGLFSPERAVNNAEVATTVARALQLEVEEGAVPSDPKFSDYPEWSKPYIAALETEGMTDVLEALGDNGAEAATRAQLAEVIGEGLLGDIDVPTDEAKDFRDVSSLSPDVREEIEKLSALEIVSGEGNSANYNPEGEVNRAAFAKMLTAAAENAGLVEETFSADEGDLEFSEEEFSLPEGEEEFDLQ